ncbi:DUF2972 domain-containing protein, partial [Campylobacter volucris]|uniref:DUF2972 domain-containing protein n=1 Tax=Campylobacter volucris TaxID=1031542 RepID=UPI0018A07AB2
HTEDNYIIKTAINKFLHIVYNNYYNIEKNKVTQKDVLFFLSKNNNKRNYLRYLFKKQTETIRQHRPDIVASWKYYQEFEKMCEELDGKDEIEQEQVKKQ